jgi:hypothetical protein
MTHVISLFSDHFVSGVDYDEKGRNEEVPLKASVCHNVPLLRCLEMPNQRSKGTSCQTEGLVAVSLLRPSSPTHKQGCA